MFVRMEATCALRNCKCASSTSSLALSLRVQRPLRDLVKGTFAKLWEEDFHQPRNMLILDIEDQTIMHDPNTETHRYTQILVFVMSTYYEQSNGQ